jgi:hypothetical protein
VLQGDLKMAATGYQPLPPTEETTLTRRTAAVASMSLFFLTAPVATATLLLAAGLYTLAVAWLVVALLVG